MIERGESREGRIEDREMTEMGREQYEERVRRRVRTVERNIRGKED